MPKYCSVVCPILLNGDGFATFVDCVSLARAKVRNTTAVIEDQFFFTESITHSHGEGARILIWEAEPPAEAFTILVELGPQNFVCASFAHAAEDVKRITTCVEGHSVWSEAAVKQTQQGEKKLSTVVEFAKGALRVGPGYFEDLMEQECEPSYFVAGPVQEQLILATEQKLGVTFPDEYRNFIALYGAMLGDGYELFGLTSDADDNTGFFRDIVKETTHSAANRSVSSHPRYIAISTDGMGTDFLIDTQAYPSLRIVAFGPGLDGVFIANSLDAFWQKMMFDTCSSLLNAAQFNSE